MRYRQRYQEEPMSDVIGRRVVKFMALSVLTATVLSAFGIGGAIGLNIYKTQQMMAHRIPVTTIKKKVASLPVPQPVVSPTVSGQWAWIQNFVPIPGDEEVCMNFNGPYEQCANVPWGTWIPLPNKP